MSKQLKLTLGMTGIFLSGMVVGAVLMGFYAKYKIGDVIREGPPAVRKIIMLKLSTDLGLNESQKNEVEQIVRETQEKLKHLRIRHQPEAEEVIGRGIEKMKPLLTKEQGAKLDLLYERAKKRWSVP